MFHDCVMNLVSCLNTSNYQFWATVFVAWFRYPKWGMVLDFLAQQFDKGS